MSNMYGSFIRQQREGRGLSQGQMAERLSISRPSYVAVEKGTKELSLSEAEALTKVFGISVDELLRAEAPNYKKYKQMILTYLREAKKDGKTLKKTKLAKLMYLADFAWFYENLESMSGMEYRKMKSGPVPSDFFRAMQELEEEGAIVVKHELKGERDMYLISEGRGSAKRTLDELSTEENILIDKVWSKWSDANTREIVDFTHEQLPYKLAFDGDVVSYPLITQVNPEDVY
jgi:transcriptional regulator with XRE-family HTH domain